MRFLILLLLLPFASVAQSTYAPLNDDYYHWVDRYEFTFGCIFTLTYITKVTLATFTASWQLRHNLFVDGSVVVRKSESEHAFYNNNTSITSLALRWNIPQRLYDF